MRIKMPAVRIAQAEVEMQQDTDVLTCGACQKAFALGDIVKFIQHKVLACNKENYGCNESTSANHSGADSDGEVGLVSRRPSISAPMKRSELGPSEPRCSTPKRRPSPSASASPTPIKAELDSTPPSVSSPEEGPCKKLRTDVADATSNTTNSEPSNYVCSTCKARLHSAWRLVQHVQNSHGIKIYVENSSSVSMSSLGSSPGTSAGKNHSSSSTCSSGSPGCSSAPPTTPLALPPPTVTSSRLPSPLIDPHLPLHNPFTVGGLLRMPLEPTRHHQFAPGSLSGGSLFARPSSHTEHHFRMEQLVSEQFRHHPLGFAAAVAAGVPPPPFGPERPPPTTRSLPPPPPSLGQSPLEPQIDFYSQRLRQLAGTTSPGAANGNSSPSPRKLTPPFTSPSTIPTTVSIAPSLMFNNNNNSSTNNNNITTARSPTPRTQQSSPPVEQKPPPPAQQSSAEPAVEETVDLTSTPRSASTPPAKPDFSDNVASESMDVSDPNKIHPCEYCGKKFRFQSNLLVHKRSHTGEKPYKCSVCNHACSQSSKLRRHMKVHKRSRSKTSCGDDGNPNGSGSVNSTPDQMSNAGSVETLDDDEDDDDDIDEDEDEEEDEDDEEEMEMEEEEGDEDDDLGGDAPEDLTTKSTSSTPPNSGDPKGGSGSPHPDKTSSGSLVGELMDKFGLNNIQQYSEAYKAALQESVGAHHLITRKDELLHRSHLMDNNNSGSKPSTRLENGLLEKSALRFREEFAKNMITGQPQLDLVGGPHGIFGPTFENPFDASKRAKLDGRDLRASDRDMYAGLWFPGLSGHHRDQMFGGNGADSDILKDKKGPTTSGPSLAAAAAAAALNLGLTSQGMKKDSRRNDTCEFCGKVFKNCSNLTVHRRSHTGEKPYKCELCSYACAQSSKLTRHMKTHGRMGKDVYRCRFCEMPFSVPSTLEKHMRKCVVNQNIKVEHMLPSMMSGDEDSAASTPKDTAST